MGQLMTLLNGALDAREKVLLKLNVSADRYQDVLAVLPSAKSPTVSELAGGRATPSRASSRSARSTSSSRRSARPAPPTCFEIPISKIVP